MSVKFKCASCNKNLGAYYDEILGWNPEDGFTYQYWDNRDEISVVICNDDDIRRSSHKPCFSVAGCWFNFCKKNKIVQVPGLAKNDVYYRKVK